MKRDYPRAYESWTKEEDSSLIDEHKMGLPLSEIALKHQRKIGAIESRQRKLGLKDRPTSAIRSRSRLQKLEKNEYTSAKVTDVKSEILMILGRLTPPSLYREPRAFCIHYLMFLKNSFEKEKYKVKLNYPVHIEDKEGAPIGLVAKKYNITVGVDISTEKHARWKMLDEYISQNIQNIILIVRNGSVEDNSEGFVDTRINKINIFFMSLEKMIILAPEEILKIALEKQKKDEKMQIERDALRKKNEIKLKHLYSQARYKNPHFTDKIPKSLTKEILWKIIKAYQKSNFIAVNGSSFEYEINDEDWLYFSGRKYPVAYEELMQAFFRLKMGTTSIILNEASERPFIWSLLHDERIISLIGEKVSSAQTTKDRAQGQNELSERLVEITPVSTPEVKKKTKEKKDDVQEKKTPKKLYTRPKKKIIYEVTPVSTTEVKKKISRARLTERLKQNREQQRKKKTE